MRVIFEVEKGNISRNIQIDLDASPMETLQEALIEIGYDPNHLKDLYVKDSQEPKRYVLVEQDEDAEEFLDLLNNESHTLESLEDCASQWERLLSEGLESGVLRELVQGQYTSLDELQSFVRDYYVGLCDSFLEFAQQMFKELYGSVVEHFLTYIDWEKYARDLEHNYIVFEGDSGVHIFSA